MGKLVVASKAYASTSFLCLCFEYRPENIQEVWFEESNDMIRGMAALSSAVGLSKSFSTSDITDLLTNDEDNAENGFLPVKRNAISELAISASQHSGYLFEQSVKLDNASRSCSTWVAVGDIPSTSQLPSPHGGAVPSAVLTSNTPSCGPSFTPADLIRSVNKKVTVMKDWRWGRGRDAINVMRLTFARSQSMK